MSLSVLMTHGVSLTPTGLSLIGFNECKTKKVGTASMSVLWIGYHFLWVSRMPPETDGSNSISTSTEGKTLSNYSTLLRAYQDIYDCLSSLSTDTEVLSYLLSFMLHSQSALPTWRTEAHKQNQLFLTVDFSILII